MITMESVRGYLYGFFQNKCMGTAVEPKRKVQKISTNLWDFLKRMRVIS